MGWRCLPTPQFQSAKPAPLQFPSMPPPGSSPQGMVVGPMNHRGAPRLLLEEPSYIAAPPTRNASNVSW